MVYLKIMPISIDLDDCHTVMAVAHQPGRVWNATQSVEEMLGSTPCRGKKVGPGCYSAESAKSTNILLRD